VTDAHRVRQLIGIMLVFAPLAVRAYRRKT
jgi:hypothetical protein